MMVNMFGIAKHLWMRDSKTLAEELKKVGFKSIRVCSFNDSADNMFKFVESEGRFKNAVSIKCIK